MPKYCIGIDLGGTSVKAALVDAKMAICARGKVPTPADGGADAVIEAMAVAAEEAAAGQGAGADEMLGVGIGSPGPLDLENGIVIGMPNIPGFERVPIRDRLAERLAMPAVLENDANAAALGESLAGSGKGVRDMVLLT
ncbi:hypothetical protein LCGC14_2823220, partial [marine sediment metagenome]